MKRTCAKSEVSPTVQSTDRRHPQRLRFNKPRCSAVLPVLAEVLKMGDGSVMLRPKAARMASDGDTWLTPGEAGKILGISSRNVYRYCERISPYLACRRPAKGRVLVSMKSVARLFQATLNPEFWDDELQQKEVCEYAQQILTALQTQHEVMGTSA